MDKFIKSSFIKRINLHSFNPEEGYINEGASGSIYRHRQDGKPYIVKLIDSSEWDEYDFYEDILWQTEIIKYILDCKRVITFYGYDIREIDNVIQFMVLMEDKGVDGDLSDYICNNNNNWETINNCDKNRLLKNNNCEYITYNTEGNIYQRYTLDREEKLSIIIQLIEAVKEIHDKGVIHADIKPDNIIYNKDNKELQLIDFSASLFKVEDVELIETDWKHGTLGYRAPEEEYDNLIGTPSDIYSLGVTIIEIMVGNIWCGAESFKTCRNEVLKSLRMIEKNDIDNGIGILLRKCVSLHSNNRITINNLLEGIKQISNS